MTKTLKDLIEENLHLLETVTYSEIVKSTMIKRCAYLLSNYTESDFDGYMKRLKKVEYEK